MKVNYPPARYIQIIAILMSITGVIVFFCGVSKSEEYLVMDGVATFIASIFAYGFSFIVEAACKYIDIEEEEEEADEDE